MDVKIKKLPKLIIALAAMLTLFLVAATAVTADPPNAALQGAAGTFTADADAEYSTTATGPWRPVWGAHDAVPYANSTLHFRLGETTGELQIPVRANVPAACPSNETPAIGWVIDFAAETVIGTGLQVQFGTSDWVGIDAVRGISAVWGNTINVRTAGGAAALPSAGVPLALPARPAAPTTPVYDAATDTIVGVDSTMQFRLGAIGEWHPIASGATTIGRVATGGADGFGLNAAEQTVYVRVAPTDARPPSFPMYVTVAANNVAAPEWDDDPINFELETITFPDVNGADLQYRVVRTTTVGTEYPVVVQIAPWTTVASEGVINLGELGFIADAPAAGTTVVTQIFVRVAGMPPSASSVAEVIPNRAAAPDTAPASAFVVAYSGVNANVTAVPNNTEWNVVGTSLGGNTEGASNFLVVATEDAQTVRVRAAATNSAFASAWTTGDANIGILARLPFPAAADIELVLDNENSDGDAIVGLEDGAGWEFIAVPGGVEPTQAFTALTVEELVRATHFGAIANGGNVFIRVESSANAPASMPHVVAVPGGLGLLANIGINYANETWTNVPANAQINSGDGWGAIVTGTPSLAALIPAATVSDPLEVQFRIGEADNARVRTLEIAPRSALNAPEHGWVDYINERLVFNAHSNRTLQWHNGTAWAAFTENVTLTTLMNSVTSGSLTVSVRMQAEDSAFASAEQTAVIRPRAAAIAFPFPAYNSDVDAIVNVIDTMEWRPVGGSTWNPVADGAVTITRVALTEGGYASGNIEVRRQGDATIQTPPSLPFVVTDIGQAPAGAPNLGAGDIAQGYLNIGIDFGDETVTGNLASANNIQYSIDGVAWHDANGAITLADYFSNIGAASPGGIQFRFNTAPENPLIPPSQASAVFPIPGRPAMPNVGFNVETEVINSTATQLVRMGTTATIGDEQFAAGDANRSLEAALNSHDATDGNFIVHVANPHRATVPATQDDPAIIGEFRSVPRVITIAPRPAAPDTPRYDGNTDSIVGVNNTMQIKMAVTENGLASAEWERVTGTTISREAMGDNVWFQFRTMFSGATPASQPGTAFGVPAADAAGNQTPANAFTINWGAETITVEGFAELVVPLEWRVGTSGNFTLVDAATIDISGIIPAAGLQPLTIQYRAIGNAAGQPGTPVDVTIPARAAIPVPAPRFQGVPEYEIVNVTGLQLFAGGEWEPATDVIVFPTATAQTYTFRVPYNSTPGINQAFSSVDINVTVPARRAAPDAAYDGASDSVRGVTAAMQFATTDPTTGADVDWVQVVGTFISRAQAGGGASPTVWVRLSATVAQPASLPVEITFEQIVAAPNPTVNHADETLTVTGLMQFSTNSGRTWTTFNQAAVDNGFNLTPHIPAAGRAANEIWVRYAATNYDNASAHRVLTLNARPAAPTASTANADRVWFDTDAEQLVFVNTGGHTYQWRTGATAALANAQSWTSDVTGAGTRVNMPTDDTAFVIQTRIQAAGAGSGVTADEHTFASATASINVAARRAEPGVRVAANGTTITGLTNAMLIRFVDEDGNGDWVDAPRGNLDMTLADNEDYDLVEIKLPATATARHSRIFTWERPDD